MNDLVFLFDVDNTLLDNDAFQADLSDHLEKTYGAARRDRYWALFEEERERFGFVDYLAALQRLRVENLRDPSLLKMASWFFDYPFASRVYPRAFEAVRHCAQWGPVVVLSDGDAAFQPLKVRRSGVGAVFGDDVLIYIHKEQDLADIERLYPARHYALIDDKLRILTAVKTVWRERVTTVFPRQGHYATDPVILAECPPADVTVDGVADLLALDRAAFEPAAADKVG